MMLALALVALFCSIVVVAFLLLWHPHELHPPTPSESGGDWRPGLGDELVALYADGGFAPPAVHRSSVHDWCEFVIDRTEDPETGERTVTTCPEPPTHELSAPVTRHGGGSSTTVATYCAEHAPEGAVRVRTLADG